MQSKHKKTLLKQAGGINLLSALFLASVVKMAVHVIITTVKYNGGYNYIALKRLHYPKAQNRLFDCLALCALLLMVGCLSAWLMAVYIMAVCLLSVGCKLFAVGCLAVWLFGLFILAVICFAVGSLLMYVLCL